MQYTLFVFFIRPLNDAEFSMLIKRSKHSLRIWCQHFISEYLRSRHFIDLGHCGPTNQNIYRSLRLLRRLAIKWMSITRRRTHQHTFWPCVCCQIPAIFPSIELLCAVLDPEGKMVHFKKHWSEDLQQKVLDCAEEVVCGTSDSAFAVLKSRLWRHGHTISSKNGIKR